MKKRKISPPGNYNKQHPNEDNSYFFWCGKNSSSGRAGKCKDAGRKPDFSLSPKEASGKLSPNTLESVSASSIAFAAVVDRQILHPGGFCEKVRSSRYPRVSCNQPKEKETSFISKTRGDDNVRK